MRGNVSSGSISNAIISGTLRTNSTITVLTDVSASGGSQVGSICGKVVNVNGPINVTDTVTTQQLTMSGNTGMNLLTICGEINSSGSLGSGNLSINAISTVCGQSLILSGGIL